MTKISYLWLVSLFCILNLAIWRAGFDLLFATPQTVTLRSNSFPSHPIQSNPLLPFEVSSSKFPDPVCDPPSSIPRRCCVGSTSAGGNLFWKPEICSNTPYDDYPPLIPDFTHDLISTLARRNLSLVIVGDSVMYQAAVGLECAWLRANCTSVNSYTPRKKRGNWRYGVGGIEEWSVTCGSFTAPPISYFSQYRPYADQSEIHEQLSASDVYVFNSGAHYLRKELALFRNETTAWLESVYEWATAPASPNTKYAIFRETAAQHRDSLGGEWNEKINTSNCVPLTWNANQPYNWRNELVAEWAREVGFDKTGFPLQILHAYKETVPWFNLHPGAAQEDKGCEPTHYCHHPALWQNVWWELTTILK